MTIYHENYINLGTNDNYRYCPGNGTINVVLHLFVYSPLGWLQFVTVAYPGPFYQLLCVRKIQEDGKQRRH